MPRWPLAWLTAAPLAPWLIVQGRRVRRVVPLLPEPPGDRAGHWQLDLGRPHDGSALRVLLLGDSSMAGVGAAHQHQALSGSLARVLHRPAGGQCVAWQLLARTGLRTQDVVPWLATVNPPVPCEIVVVALGVNDVTALQSATAFRRDVHRLIEHLRQTHRAQAVLWCGLPPVHRFAALPQPLRMVLGRKAIELDAVLRTLGSAYLPMPEMLADDWIASDGFHPGPKAYDAWAGAIAPVLHRTISQAVGFRASICA